MKTLNNIGACLSRKFEEVGNTEISHLGILGGIVSAVIPILLLLVGFFGPLPIITSWVYVFFFLAMIVGWGGYNLIAYLILKSQSSANLSFDRQYLLSTVLAGIWIIPVLDSIYNGPTGDGVFALLDVMTVFLGHTVLTITIQLVIDYVMSIHHAHKVSMVLSFWLGIASALVAIVAYPQLINLIGIGLPAVIIATGILSKLLLGNLAEETKLSYRQLLLTNSIVITIIFLLWSSAEIAFTEDPLIASVVVITTSTAIGLTVEVLIFLLSSKQ